MSDVRASASAAKRQRTEGESKQSLLAWIYRRDCSACNAVKYTANVDVLARLKQAHLHGEHSWAIGVSGDSLATVELGKSEQACVAATEKSQIEAESKVPGIAQVPEASTPTARVAVTVRAALDEAHKLLRASPSFADRDIFIFQQPLIQVITDRMPANDKFDHEQRVAPWMKEAIQVMVEPAQEAKDAYKGEVCETFGELQDRPHMSSIPTGLKKILPKIAARESATKYLEKVKKSDGSFEYVEKYVSPPPQDISTAHESSSKKQNQRWVMDILMFALMSGACLKNEDIYQAALGGARLLLDRLQKRLPIDRLYLKVWSSEKYTYAILDVFGYVELHDGKVTPESYWLFERQVAAQRTRCGDSFQEEAFRDCTTSVEAMEELFMQRELEFRARFSGVGLPGIVKVPVGVLYVSQETRPFPTGAKLVEEDDACLFYQGMLRAVSSNSILGWDKKKLEANVRQAREDRLQKYPVVKWKDEANCMKLDQPLDVRAQVENYRLSFDFLN